MSAVMKIALAASVSFALIACGPRTVLQPDGGPSPFTCTVELVSMTVQVVDAAGAPVEGATVTATNLGTQKTVTAQTNASGVTTAVTEDLGQGTASLTATFGGRVSTLKNVTWTCGQCHCNPDPGVVTLTLSP